MKNFKLNHKIIGSLLIIIALYLYFREPLYINWIVFLVVSRGILTANCSWWRVSSLFLKDASGVNLYYDLKNKYKQKIVPINMLGYKINMVVDINFIKTILDNSPDTFDVGKLKKTMFQSFMPGNVGVSSGLEWVSRRELNERVLNTNQIHQYASYFDLIIQQSFQKKIPTNFSQFTQTGKECTNRIVFNRTDIEPAVYNIFSEANSYYTLLTGRDPVDPRTKSNYRSYLNDSLDKPQHPSLVELSLRYSSDREDLIQQIPHWIFPIVGLFSTSFPRLLLTLINHPPVFQKLINNIRGINSSLPIHIQIAQCDYLRKCILELLRLNNPVVTTFRTLAHDFNFDEEHGFKRGEQFLILNNPVLRSPEYFQEPNKYIPERWTPEIEDSYYAISFNQGPQKCPGKDLAIFILQSITLNYLRQSNIVRDGIQKIKGYQIDTNDFPQMINPCTISFQLSN